jgi:hypothetical protein
MTQIDFSALLLREGKDGIYLEVRARPGARRPGITGVHDGALKVALKSPPEGGKANAELTDFLAEHLALRRDQVTLARGAASRKKTLLISGLNEAALRLRLGKA